MESRVVVSRGEGAGGVQKKEINSMMTDKN